MKLAIFGTLLLFTCVLGDINYVFDDIPENYGRKLYDVHEVMQDIAKNIEISRNIDLNKDFLLNNDVQRQVNILTFINIFTMLMNSISTTNSTCSNDFKYITENIDFKHLQDSWALKMLDSYGKPEKSILEGNVKWLGDFDECRKVYAPKEHGGVRGGFYGQYCTLQAILMKILTLSIGLCLPDTCSPADFNEIFQNSNLMPLLNQSGIDFNVTSLTCKSNSLEMSTGGIVTLCIISLFFLLVILGSSLTAFKHFAGTNTANDRNRDTADLVGIVSDQLPRGKLEIQGANKESPTEIAFIDKCDPFLNCFCIFTNGSKLLNTDATEGQLMCLHGIRFLSMTWVILAHVYSMPQVVVGPIKSAIPLVDNLPFQVVLNAWYSVDSFFVLSGFLMSYLYFQERTKRPGSTPWLYFYVHRYLRLTPVYMIVLAFYATILHLMGSGPFWPDGNVDPGCQKAWWYNLIYINNFQKSGSNQCLPWSWYLANDMQFFVISPIFLITLWRWPKIGFLVSTLFLCGSWLCGFSITYLLDLPAGTFSDVSKTLLDPVFLLRYNDYMDKIYVKPYTRIAPYIVGIGLGYILFKRTTSSIKSNRTTLWIGWLLAAPAGLYCIYGTYQQSPNVLAASFYNAFCHTLYGLSLSWLIFVCLSGQGGVVDKILSYKLFIPLSRLTYCAYLIHPIITIIAFFSLKHTIVFSHLTIILWYFGILILTYAFSLLVSLTFESPLIRLEKLIKNKFQSR